MVVYNTDDFRFINAVDNLFLFIMINEKYLLFRCGGYASRADDADIFRTVDDNIPAFSRHIVAVIGRGKHSFRIVNKVFNQIKLIARYRPDKFFRQSAALQNTGKLAVIDNRREIVPLMIREPACRIFQRSGKSKRFHVAVHRLAHFDIKIRYERLRRYLKILQRKRRFFVKFACANRYGIYPLQFI